MLHAAGVVTIRASTPTWGTPDRAAVLLTYAVGQGKPIACEIWLVALADTRESPAVTDAEGKLAIAVPSGVVDVRVSKGSLSTVVRVTVRPGGVVTAQALLTSAKQRD